MRRARILDKLYIVFSTTSRFLRPPRTHPRIRPIGIESGADVAEGRKIYFTLDISNDLDESGREGGRASEPLDALRHTGAGG